MQHISFKVVQIYIFSRSLGRPTVRPIGSKKAQLSAGLIAATQRDIQFLPREAYA